MESNKKFQHELLKIKEPQIFIGVARILKVKLLSEEKDSDGKFLPRDFSEIYKDVMDAYASERRERRRELYKILKAANKVKANEEETEGSAAAEGETNADNSENT